MNMIRCPWCSYGISSTLSCDFQPLTVIANDVRMISDVFVKFSQEKHCGRKRIHHGCLCATEFALVSLYSTEITHHRQWFLEYKLTRVNPVPHGRQWWIHYLHNCIMSSHNCVRTCIHVLISMIAQRRLPNAIMDIHHWIIDNHNSLRISIIELWSWIMNP